MQLIVCFYERGRLLFVFYERGKLLFVLLKGVGFCLFL